MDQINTRALIMEFIGTFSLIFIGGWSVFDASIKTGKTGVLYAALAHGTVLGIMVYIGAKISGGHYNPAVTLGLLISGNSEIVEAILYIFSQLLGSVIAGFSLKYMKPGKYNNLGLGYPAISKDVTLGKAFAMEFFGAFFLIFSIYACAVHRGASPEACAAIIGLTLFFGIASFGDSTGGALNPARTFGPSIADGKFRMPGWWVYYTGTTLGGIVAALTYRFVLEGGEEEEVKTIKEE